MNILLSWLKDYVDIDTDVKELEKKLFSSGFEVEGVKYLGEGIEKIVVGEITQIEPFEGTHLLDCRLDCGEYGKDIIILTGASNVFVGAHVPVALVGAHLPNGMEIQPRKMQGRMSYGMLCSGGELGIDDNWYPGAGVNGILILDKDTKIGESICDTLELDDYVFDISVTANRPDCQSVIGIAREVAAFLHKEFKMPDLSYSETDVRNDKIGIEVMNKELCPRYLGHYIYDIKDVETPLWMKRRLSVHGFNSISALVDITNYVLVEMGQPMHAYDLDTLTDSKIIVRRAVENEEITTLDEKKYNLTTNNLVICDAENPIGLAGVMGGLNSEITDSTKEVVFESAKFLKDNIRKTSRHLGIRTDAAARFEKGIDEYSVETGMARALNLAEKLGVAKISSTKFDISAGASTEKRKITININDIEKVLGIRVPEDEIVKILDSLLFEVEADGDVLNISIPRYREDVESYQDIAEEVIREYGYDHVVPKFLNNAQVTNGGLNIKQQKELALKNLLTSQGFYEVQTIAMYSQKELDQLLIDKDSKEYKAIPLINPITEKLSLMRTLMAPSMLNVIVENIKREHFSGNFFEIANVYIADELPLKKIPEERKTLSLGMYGYSDDFFAMKKKIEAIASANGIEFEYKANTSVPFLHPGKTASIFCNGVNLGYFGKLRYEIVSSLNIADGKKNDLAIYIAEIDYAELSRILNKPIKYVPSSPYTGVSRDISLLVNKDIECADIMNKIYEADSLIRKVSFVDLYENEKLGFGKKSMTFSMDIASDDKDVTEDMAAEVFGKVVKHLEAELGALIRG